MGFIKKPAFIKFPGGGNNEEDKKKSDFSFTLTPTGKHKADTLSANRGELEILSVLQDEGVLTVSQIADRLDVPENKARSIMNSLIRSRYIKRT